MLPPAILPPNMLPSGVLLAAYWLLPAFHPVLSAVHAVQVFGGTEVAV